MNKNNKKRIGMLILTGGLIGLLAVLLVVMGNPKNMGVCTACFIRDTAGALGLHQATPVQYVRPEIFGIVLGALLLAFVGKEYSARAGSSPMTRFVLGMCVMIGALVFLGCPLRMILRLAGGDLNAIVGLVGFVVGIMSAIFFLKRGFSLKRNYEQSVFEGLYFPIIIGAIFAISVFVPSLLKQSVEGPGSMHAPILISLIVGIIVGAIAQKTRLCFVSGIRDAILFKDFSMIYALISMLVVAIIGNMITGNFNVGFDAQPIAHTDGLYNFLGLYIVGLGSALLGGCPLRQLILASSGNSDSAVTVLGLFAGAALAHNFQLASSATGASSNGKVAALICVIVIVVIAIVNSKAIFKKGE